MLEHPYLPTTWLPYLLIAVNPERQQALVRQNKFYEGWDLKRFVRFMENSKLLLSKGDEIYLNQTGRNFLNFLNHFGLSDVRPI